MDRSRSRLRRRHRPLPRPCAHGYPPEDFVLKPAFVRDNQKPLEVVAQARQGISAVVGIVDEDGDIFNAAALIHDDELKASSNTLAKPCRESSANRHD
jgi:hypothetical protein